MSVTLREYSNQKNNSIVALCSLLFFFTLTFFDLGLYTSIMAFVFYIVFNLRWLHNSYTIFVRESENATSTSKKTVIVNFIPFVCFYQPYYNIIELLKFANRNILPAYFNWFLQLVTIVYLVVQAFGDQNFEFIYFTMFVWAGFAFYLYQGVNSRVYQLMK
jgi:hypothetical protein